MGDGVAVDVLGQVFVYVAADTGQPFVEAERVDAASRKSPVSVARIAAGVSIELSAWPN